MITETEIRWGILGCGDVTERKSGPAFNKAKGSRLVAVMRRNGELAADYAKRHSVPKWYDNADDLINDPEINAIYIATPPGSHEELALKVAAADKPCYVEKPMARNAAECQRMVQAFKSANLPLFVAYYRRALPHFLSAKKWIDDKKLGSLLEVRYTFSSLKRKNSDVASQWRFQPETSGGGLLWDLGSHVLDLFDFWLGPIDNIKGSRRNISGIGKVEEIAHLNAWAGKVSVSLAFNFIAPFPMDQIELVFENGKIETPAFQGSSLKIHRPESQTIVESFEVPDSIQEPLIKAIVHSLQTGAHSPSTGESALRTNLILDQMLLI